MFFDSHCHLDRIDLEGFDHSLDNLLATAHEAGVADMICIGVNLESFESMYATIKDREGVYATVGVHPDYEDVRAPTVRELLDYAEREKIVAIGETGLDYYHTDGPDWQRERFHTHIEAALQCNKPLVIHTRQAKQDTLGILREHQAERVGGVLHCFTEDWDMARQAIDMGFYISISGIVTFKQAENVREMAVKIPRDRLLIETDAPWLAPVPFRGKVNHPANVALVAAKLAEIRNEDMAQLAATTRANACRLFGL